MKKLITVLVSSVLFSGCASMAPEYNRPTVDVPETWRTQPESIAGIANSRWWENFNDKVLEELITVALENNKDIRIAAARINEFAASVDIARAGLYPQIGYGGDASRSQASRNSSSIIPNGTSRVSDNFQASLNVGWELDFWGKVASASDAARADLLAAEEGRRAVILSLVTSVASSYVQLKNLDQQLKIARTTVSRRGESLDLFKVKFKGGVVSELEVAQIQSEYEFAQITVPTIERQIALLENSLSILLGQNPGAIIRDNTSDSMTMMDIPSDIPADVLLRRPDIRRAENALIAANARIGVAKAAYFPTISLTGLLGFASADLSDLVEGSSGVYSVGGGLLGPIFAGGSIDAQLRQSEATQQRLLVEYQQTIQTALREVDDALISYQKLQEQLAAQTRQVAALSDYARLARIRYDDGYVSYIEVLDAERSLFDSELQLAQKQSDLFASFVDIYKSMGGGWIDQAEVVANQVDYPKASDDKQQQSLLNFPSVTYPSAQQAQQKQ